MKIRSELTPIFVMFAVVLLGCVVDSGNALRDRRGRITNAVLLEVGRVVEAAAVKTFLGAISPDDKTTRIDLAHAAASNLWSEAPSIVSSDSLRRIIDAASINQLKGVSSVAAQQFASHPELSSGDKLKLTNSIAKAISDAALSTNH